MTLSEHLLQNQFTFHSEKRLRALCFMTPHASMFAVGAAFVHKSHTYGPGLQPLWKRAYILVTTNPKLPKPLYMAGEKHQRTVLNDSYHTESQLVTATATFTNYWLLAQHSSCACECLRCRIGAQCSHQNPWPPHENLTIGQ